MYIRDITYTDFNGEERTDTCCFHLTKAEVVDWLTTSGDYTLDKVVEKLVSSHNGKEIMNIFKDMIRRSYGVKSLDGKRFIKTKEVQDEFFESEAYSVLFMELVTDAAKAGEFFMGILPSDLSDEINKFMKDSENLPEEFKKYFGEKKPEAIEQKK